MGPAFLLRKIALYRSELSSGFDWEAAFDIWMRSSNLFFRSSASVSPRTIRFCNSASMDAAVRDLTASYLLWLGLGSNVGRPIC